MQTHCSFPRQHEQEQQLLLLTSVTDASVSHLSALQAPCHCCCPSNHHKTLLWGLTQAIFIGASRKASCIPGQPQTKGIWQHVCFLNSLFAWCSLCLVPQIKGKLMEPMARVVTTYLNPSLLLDSTRYGKGFCEHEGSSAILYACRAGCSVPACHASPQQPQPGDHPLPCTRQGQQSLPFTVSWNRRKPWRLSEMKEAPNSNDSLLTSLSRNVASRQHYGFMVPLHSLLSR